MNSKNNQLTGLLDSAFGVAKKLSHSGLEVLNKVGKNQEKTQIPQQADNTEQSFPNLSKQLLGRHYASVNKVTSFVAPDLTDKFSDYLFEQLNHLGSRLSAVDQILDEAGVKDLEELTQDVDRSQRLSELLAKQNQWLASAQGALSGATGVLGSAVDVPASLLLSLRSIYQIGRAYGFELSKETEQEMVQFVFKQVDLSLIAQKQTLLVALKALSNALETHDLNQLQQLLGTNQDTETLKQWLQNEDGQAKFAWLNQLSKLSVLTKLTPVAGASLSAAYSWKLLEDVNQKARAIFSEARAYLQQHQDLNLSPMSAYQKSREYLAIKQQVGELQLNQAIELDDHATISKVVIQKKDQAADVSDNPSSISQDFEKLAADMVEPHAKVAAQKPALTQELEAKEVVEYVDSDNTYGETITSTVEKVQSKA